MTLLKNRGTYSWSSGADGVVRNFLAGGSLNQRTIQPCVATKEVLAQIINTAMRTIKAEIPDDVHEALIAQAAGERISVDMFVSRALRAAFALPLLGLRVEERATQGNWGDFDGVMSRVPNAPPVPGDER